MKTSELIALLQGHMRATNDDAEVVYDPSDNNGNDMDRQDDGTYRIVALDFVEGTVYLHGADER